MINVSYPLFTGVLFYLDPGSGSFLIQLLLAVILGLGVAARMYWSKIKALFVKNNVQSGTATEEEEIEE